MSTVPRVHMTGRRSLKATPMNKKSKVNSGPDTSVTTCSLCSNSFDGVTKHCMSIDGLCVCDACSTKPLARVIQVLMAKCESLALTVTELKELTTSLVKKQLNLSRRLVY
ncbi:unnamed protein product [Dicrocoelium dendriticum]|nr:unnamed protein product [Dicrocoelium dendriticum]